jgi:beta-hydroxylase
MYLATFFLILFGAIFFVASSIIYVFKLRGNAHFSNFNEYIRYGWPFFAPFNCFLYLSTKKFAKKSIIINNHEDAILFFQELNILKKNWNLIHDEALNLYQQGYLASDTKVKLIGSYDLGFGSFLKYGWNKFYLKWYGTTHNSAIQLFPKTLEIINQIPSIRGAMISILPPGSKLKKHMDPYAGCLRYHLALSTPNNDQCFINIDNQIYSWRDGQALLFDETFLHFAENNTKENRIILMCDIERPLNNKVAQWLCQLSYKLLSTSLVPNTSQDKAGFFSKALFRIAPYRLYFTNWKKHHLILYRISKKMLFFILISCFLVSVIYLARSF